MSNKVSEGKICRSIIDRHDVMKNQILNAVLEQLSEGTSHDEKVSLQNAVAHVFDVHTNGLLTNVSKQFAG